MSSVVKRPASSSSVNVARDTSGTMPNTFSTSGRTRNAGLVLDTYQSFSLSLEGKHVETRAATQEVRR